ncbi:MAG: acetolactate decarboxylase [Lachnospiraceae bacterium]|nr:acetolactate decarboxylase [Lachnospiraceae bacterium]
MDNAKIFQVSTLQALMLGYSRAVINVSELLKHGNIGLGTYEDVDGEMIVIDGVCYRATDNGQVVEAKPDMGVPFSTVYPMKGIRTFELGSYEDADSLKQELNILIEEDFGLNSMHMVRIDGEFSLVDARSESGYKAIHVSLKNLLSKTQKAFCFENIKGSLVCVYFPDYMDGINAAGWHLHFISDDRKLGGHVFNVSMKHGHGFMDKINSIELKLPDEPVFDTYSLKEASEDEVKEVEQGKG